MDKLTVKYNVKNCKECPLNYYDPDWGDYCVLTGGIDLETLTQKRIMSNCPLKNGDIVIKLIEDPTT